MRGSESRAPPSKSSMAASDRCFTMNQYTFQTAGDDLEHRSETLPARYYTDPELFRREMESFFFEGWICAGRADSIPNPGDYFLREIAGESIIIVARRRRCSGKPFITYAAIAVRACVQRRRVLSQGASDARIMAGPTGLTAAFWARRIWIPVHFPTAPTTRFTSCTPPFGTATFS